MKMRRPRFTIAGLMVGIAIVAGGLGSFRAGRRAEQLARPRPVMVQVTAHGTRYHLPGCQYIRKGSVSVPLSEARTRYKACLGADRHFDQGKSRAGRIGSDGQTGSDRAGPVDHRGGRLDPEGPWIHRYRPGLSEAKSGRSEGTDRSLIVRQK